MSSDHPTSFPFTYLALRAGLTLVELTTLLVTLYWIGEIGAISAWSDLQGFLFWIGAIFVILIWAIMMLWEDYAPLSSAGLLRRLGIELITPAAVFLISAGDWVLAIASAHIVLMLSVSLIALRGLVTKLNPFKVAAEDRSALLIAFVILAPLFVSAVTYIGSLTVILIQQFLLDSPLLTAVGLTGMLSAVVMTYRTFMKRITELGRGFMPKMIKGWYENFVIAVILLFALLSLYVLAMASAPA